MRRIFLGIALILIGGFSGIMLALISMDGANRAERMALLAERGVSAIAQDVVLGPSASNQRLRGLRYEFDAGAGVIQFGADGLPVSEVSAFMAAGMPEILYLPERPDVNALARNVAEWQANSGTTPRAQPWQTRFAMAFAGIAVVLGLALLLRRGVRAS